MLLWLFVIRAYASFSAHCEKKHCFIIQLPFPDKIIVSVIQCTDDATLGFRKLYSGWYNNHVKCGTVWSLSFNTQESSSGIRVGPKWLINLSLCINAQTQLSLLIPNLLHVFVRTFVAIFSLVESFLTIFLTNCGWLFYHVHFLQNWPIQCFVTKCLSCTLLEIRYLQKWQTFYTRVILISLYCRAEQTDSQKYCNFPHA